MPYDRALVNYWNRMDYNRRVNQAAASNSYNRMASERRAADSRRNHNSFLAAQSALNRSIQQSNERHQQFWTRFREDERRRHDSLRRGWDWAPWPRASSDGVAPRPDGNRVPDISAGILVIWNALDQDRVLCIGQLFLGASLPFVTSILGFNIVNRLRMGTLGRVGVIILSVSPTISGLDIMFDSLTHLLNSNNSRPYRAMLPGIVGDTMVLARPNLSLDNAIHNLLLVYRALTSVTSRIGALLYLNMDFRFGSLWPSQPALPPPPPAAPHSHRHRRAA